MSGARRPSPLACLAAAAWLFGAACLVAAAWLAAASTALAAPVGDVARGEAAHEVCLQCHDTSVYVPPKRRVKTLAALERETRRWADMYNPRLNAQEIADLVAFLNARFYRF